MFSICVWRLVEILNQCETDPYNEEIQAIMSIYKSRRYDTKAAEMKLSKMYDLLDTPSRFTEVNICQVLKRSNELISQSMHYQPLFTCAVVGKWLS